MKNEEVIFQATYYRHAIGVSFLAFIFGVIYYRIAPEYWENTEGALEKSIVGLTLVAILFLAGALAYDRGKPRKVIIDDKGVQFEKKVWRWEQIEKIQPTQVRFSHTKKYHIFLSFRRSRISGSTLHFEKPLSKDQWNVIAQNLRRTVCPKYPNLKII